VSTQFKVGDDVCIAIDIRQVGTVVEIYEKQREVCCVVRFADGSTSVFFDYQLIDPHSLT
jgi:hypothetical protein